MKNESRNFALVGYDKDNDIFDDLMLDTLDKCREVAEILKPLIMKDRVLSSCREGYDWLEIWDYNTEERVEIIDLY